MKTILTAAFALLIMQGFAKDKELIIKSTIDEVTVYQQGAQVIRTAKTPLPPGTLLLIFEDLHSSISPDQIRITGDGDFTILSMYHDYKTDTLSGADYNKKYQEYQKQRQRIQEQMNEEQGWLSIYDKEEQMLAMNQNFGSQANGVDIDKLKVAADYIRERYKDIRSQRLQIQENVKALQKQMYELDLKTGEFKSLKTETHLRKIVRVRNDKQTTAEFKISYQVNNAGWIPSYDARVNSIEAPLELIYNAFVYQSSGEDWEDVNLIISTGNPKNNRTKPSLTPIYLQNPRPQGQTQYINPNQYQQSQAYNPNVGQVTGQLFDANGQPLIGGVVQATGTNVGTTTDMNGSYSLTLPIGATTLTYNYIGHVPTSLNVSGSVMNVTLGGSDMLMDAVVISEESLRNYTMQETQNYYAPAQTLSLTPTHATAPAPVPASTFATVAVAYSPTQTLYRVEGKYDFPTDGKQYSVQLKNFEMQTDYMYQCVPKLDLTAYLTARIMDWQEFNLLNGKMHVYFEDSYVGESNLRLDLTADTLNISLGPDPSIKVNRQRVKSDSKKKIMSSDYEVTREWEITVLNAKREKINIRIEDQLPLSTSEEIEVNAETLSGGTHDETNGRVFWDLAVNPGKDKTVNLRYNVRYPKNLALYVE
jgi:hypothetical protein